MDRRTVKRERIVWGILGALFLIAACFGAAEFLATRLPGEYAVVRGVLTENVDIDKETGTAVLALSDNGTARQVRFKTGVRAYHWDESPMDLTELTAGKEIEVFVDPYDEAAAPAVHDGCYRIVVCDGPVPSAVPA